MAIKLFEGSAAIDKAIASIKNRGVKLDNDIQVAGLSIIAHTEKTGDYTKANMLLGAMPKGTRKNALVGWFLAFGKVALLDKAVAEDAEKIKAGETFKFNREKSTDMEGAMAQPWTEFRHKDGAATDVVIDVQAELKAFLKRLKAKADKEGAKVEHADMIVELAKIAG